MLSRSLALSVVCSVLASFLFGFHSGVISFSLPLLTLDFSLSVAQQQLCVAILLLGAMVGALLCQPLSDRLGRKKSLMVVGAIFSSATMVMVFSEDFSTFIAARFFCGVATGLASTLPPMYIAEIAPPFVRGRLVAYHQLMVATGIFLSYVSCYVLSYTNSWQKMIVVGLFFSLMQLLLACFAIESPLWKKSRPHLGRMDLAFFAVVRSKKILKLFFIAVVLNIAQQFSGINTVIYYTPVILKSIGMESGELALIAATITGATSCLATALSSCIVDYLGRKKLLILSLAGMALAIFILVLAKKPLIGFASVVAYTAFFALGAGPVIVLVTAEIFPTRCRAFCVGAATLCNWICNFLLSLYFLTLTAKLGISLLFLIFSFICIVAAIFVCFFVLETKARAVE